MKETFREELRSLINRYSLENASNTPDFILGEYMQNCLNAFEVAVQQRETWYGRDARPSALNAEKGEKCPECAILRGRIAALLSEHPMMVLENATLRKKIEDLYKIGLKECGTGKPSAELEDVNDIQTQHIYDSAYGTPSASGMGEVSEIIEFLSDRLIHRYGENPNVDYLIKAHAIAEGCK